MRDIVFHTQWCAILSMVAVQWPNFVCAFDEPAFFVMNLKLIENRLNNRSLASSSGMVYSHVQ